MQLTEKEQEYISRNVEALRPIIEAAASAPQPKKVGSSEGIAAPFRHHPTCNDPHCAICLADHEALGNYIAEKLLHRVDWLSRYRSWLDRHRIPAETETGWASDEAFATENIEAFIREGAAIGGDEPPPAQ